MTSVCTRCKHDFKTDSFRTCPKCRERDLLRKQTDERNNNRHLGSEEQQVKDQAMITDWKLNNEIKDLDVL